MLSEYILYDLFTSETKSHFLFSKFRITTISILPLPKRETRRAKNDPDPIPDPDQDQGLGLADHDQNLMNVQEKGMLGCNFNFLILV